MMDSSMNSKSTKPIAFYNERFISALKSSKVDGNIELKNLKDKCLNCYDQIKSSVNLSKFEEIRLNTTVCLLLGCPSINSLSEISNTQELMSLIKSIPEINSDTFFLIIKCLKNNKYIRGIFPWLPSDIVAEFLCSFINQSANLAPLSLVLCFEMFYSLMYSAQYDAISSDTVSENIEKYVRYLQNYETTVCNQNLTSKLIAYYFMYIVESIHVLMKYLDCKTIEEPSTCSLGLKLKAIKIVASKSDEMQYKSCVQKSIAVLSHILNKLVLCISLDIWISWYDHKAPIIALYCDEKRDVDEEKTTENKIQTQISHTVFGIMRMKNKLNTFDDVLNLNMNKELEFFLNQVAVDPDYDSDNDLNTLELIEAVGQRSTNKRKKLMSFLLNKDDIFDFKESLPCLEKHMSFITRSAALLFIKGFIKEVKDINDSEEWKSVVIDLSKRITNEDVVNILKEDLKYGHIDVLKTKLFSSDFTHICNQLSHQADMECFDSYLRLCLQSGVDVLKYSINVAISLSGLSPVFASAFRIVNCICLSKNENGLCLITNLLTEKLSEGLPLEMENELFAFTLELLERPEDSLTSNLPQSLDLSSSCQNLPVDVEEILENLICVRLKMENEDESTLSLLNLLKVLEKIVCNHSSVMLKSKVRLSCIASLFLIHNNCCYLDNKTYDINLKIRNSVEEIICTLEQFILRDIGNYEEEFALLKICLSRYELHYRSMLLLSLYIGENITEDDKPVVDKVFNCIWKKNQKDDISIPNCSRVEWIWALYIILPSCNENEWHSAMYVTHSYLNQLIGDSNLVTPTLKLFQEVFLIICDRSKLGEESLPLQYCFKLFSVTATKFAEEKLRNEENRFFLYANLFIWWCKAQRGFDCNPEYPVMFLNHLAGILVDLVREYQVIIIDNNSDNTSGLIPENAACEEPHSQVLANSSSVIGLNQDHSVNDGEGKTLNGFHESNGKNGNVSNCKLLQSSNCKVVSRDEYNDCLNSMIKIFISCIRPSELTSTVAGKLKVLCEL